MAFNHILVSRYTTNTPHSPPRHTSDCNGIAMLCKLLQGTFSFGGRQAACDSCPFNGVGFTTIPALAATSVAACMCREGFGMTQAGTCERCPPETFSVGGRDGCTPCPFGTTSAAGARGPDECHEVAQLCPVGQTAPAGAVSKHECGCYPGYGGVYTLHCLLPEQLACVTALCHVNNLYNSWESDGVRVVSNLAHN